MDISLGHLDHGWYAIVGDIPSESCHKLYSDLVCMLDKMNLNQMWFVFRIEQHKLMDHE